MFIDELLKNENPFRLRCVVIIDSLATHYCSFQRQYITTEVLNYTEPSYILESKIVGGF